MNTTTRPTPDIQRVFNRNCRSVLALLFAFTLAGATAAEKKATAAAKTPEPVKPVEIVILQSVFAENSPLGKDPFFPNSTRRNQTIIPRSETNAVVQTPPLIAEIWLKGISRSASKPLALINNATFAAGETGDVRCGLQLVKVRCLEIRDHSALIEILSLNEVRELKLREGI